MACRRRHMVAAVILMSLASVRGDLYMHHPRGSNNKLNEVSNNVRNDNRLFDSQNNGAGGYHVGDNCNPVCSNANNQYDATAPGAGKGQMYFYELSHLHIEWTNQHGCGNAQKNVQCELILQYTCDDEKNGLTNPGLRDGLTTNTVGVNEADANDPQYGVHEPLSWYQNCQERGRNKGLYTADQNLNGNRNKAIYTRQGSNGERYGYECPEERDYYPYWHPTPWRDIAIFTDDMSKCEFYETHSQNRRDKGMCCNRTLWDATRTCQQVPGFDPTGQDRDPPGPNTPSGCTRYESLGYGGKWVGFGKWSTPRPRCLRAPFSRDNHLGNSIPVMGESGELSGMTRAPSFRWQIPDHVLDQTGRSEATCVLRMRYNVSTRDFNGWNVDADKNGKAATLIDNNPNGNFVGIASRHGTDYPLKLNTNTNQYGRTFEDRSHTFQIRRRPSGHPCQKQIIHNLNVRGRRGNIVQVYPAVEYDFVPNKLELWEGECIHFQWTGSDANPAGNAGNGRRMTDRTNIVEIPALGKNKPKSLGYDAVQDGTRSRAHWSNIGSEWLVRKLAYLDQDVNLTTGEASGRCDDQIDPNQGNNDDALTNCKELNAAPGYFDTGPVVMDYPQTLFYMSTRNNDFTNRSQKGTIIVKAWRVALIIACCIVGFLMMLGAFWYWARKAQYDPNHKLHRHRIGPHVLATIKHVQRLYAKSWLHTAPWTLGLVAFCALLYLVGYWLAGGAYPLTKLEDPAPLYLHAKGCGRVLDVLCNLIFLPVLRNFTSWLRTTPLVQILPLGEEIYFHKAIAVLVALAGIGHVYCHYVDFVWHQDFGTGLSFEEQAFGNWTGFSGLLIFLCMFVMFVTAIDKVRRRRFNIGWGKYKWSFGGYSMFVRLHKLWIVVLVLLWSHSRAFWHYSLAPTALLILDKLIGRLRGKEAVDLIEAFSPTRDVLGLKLQVRSRRKFRYKSGQYLFLHCPAISKTEWHPFTISSSPEERHFSVHIRCRPDMDWTYALKTALMPDAKTKAAQDAAREKLKKLEAEEAAAAIRREASKSAAKARREATQRARHARKGRGGSNDDEPGSPRLDGAAPVDGIAGWFSNLFGGGSEKGAVTAPAAAGEASNAVKMSKAAMKSKKSVLDERLRSHKSGDNSSREHPNTTSTSEGKPLRWRPRLRTGPASCPEPVALPPPGSASAVAASASIDSAAPLVTSTSPPPSPPAMLAGSSVPIIDADGNVVELFVDGPYGSSSEEVFGFEVLVLVGAGIGVTPFASILKTLAIQAKQDRLETPLKRVAFYWVCRDDKEFETFRDLLVGIVDDRALASIFELNTYITGELDLKKASNAKQFAYNQFAGKPDWNRVARELRKDFPESDVGVFLCGPNAIGQQLVAMCNKFNPPKAQPGERKKGPRKPRFIFHKETF